MSNNSSETPETPAFPVGIYVGYACELPLLALHISVTFFVATQVHKRTLDYQYPFYKLFLVQCASNYMCWFMIVINSVAEDFFRVAVEKTFWSNLVYAFFYDYAAYLQLTTCTAVALNRFTAIVLPFSHTRIWKGNLFGITVLVSVLSPLVLTSGRPTACFLAYRATANSTSTAFDEQGQSTDSLVAAWKYAGRLRAQTLSIANIGTAVVDALLEVWALLAFHRMNLLKQQRNAQNFRLLLFTISELPLQLIKAGIYLLIRTGAYDALSMGWAGFFDTMGLYAIALQALIPPLLLLVVSPYFRQDYLDFYKRRKSPARSIVSFSDPSIRMTT